MRNVTLLIAALTLLAAASAQSTALTYAGVAPRTWSYDNGLGQQLSGPRLSDGRSVMILTHSLAGTPVSEEWLTFDPDGVRLWASANAGIVTRFDPPILLYPPPPLAAGLRWSSRSSSDRGVTIDVAGEVIGQRTVVTPAGRFDAWHLRQTTATSSGAWSVVDLFLAPEVGVVRYVTDDGAQVDLIETNR
jgi:hypothetical protein